jgi:hypothetical protein
MDINIKKSGFQDAKYYKSNLTPELVKKDIITKYLHSSDLLDAFVSNQGNIVHKWHHYIPIYDKYLHPYKNKAVKILEIGVSQGGSIQMWRKYFGEGATIYGIDIDPDCSRFNNSCGQIRIGSQVDTKFLDSVVDEMGGLDIVFDDGSHDMRHIPVTLSHLFPALNYGGLYIIEDLHTSYWKRFGGGYSSKMNFFSFIIEIVHGMHSWYHDFGHKNPAVSKDCSAIHIHDSIAVFEKNKSFEPIHSRIS